MPTLLIILVILFVVVIVILVIYINRIRAQMKLANEVLDHIANGNLDRRIIINEGTGISEICFKINEIVINLKSEIISHKQSEKSYRQLITSLSHDIRTPMASLIGYLNGVQDGIVESEEKDEFIRLSLNKALALKDYVDTLFEWLKLESGERTFNFENMDICELTREIITDWIPQMENAHIDYAISIPEIEIMANIDFVAYTRIINNLIQNVFTHSSANKIELKINVTNQIEIKIKDNGIGISERDLPYIFQRLYKCDASRGVGGNGLGLSIANELIKAHNGNISVSSLLGKGTEFTLVFPQN